MKGDGGAVATSDVYESVRDVVRSFRLHAREVFDSLTAFRRSLLR